MSQNGDVVENVLGQVGMNQQESSVDVRTDVVQPEVADESVRQNVEIQQDISAEQAATSGLNTRKEKVTKVTKSKPDLESAVAVTAKTVGVCKGKVTLQLKTIRQYVKSVSPVSVETCQGYLQELTRVHDHYLAVVTEFLVATEESDQTRHERYSKQSAEVDDEVAEITVTVNSVIE